MAVAHLKEEELKIEAFKNQNSYKQGDIRNGKNKTT